MKENIIFDAIVEFCKEKDIWSDHRAFATQISRLAIVALLSNDMGKIYTVLTDNYQSTGDIARTLGMNSKDVSSNLIRLAKETTLVHFTRDGKLKYWRKI